MCDQTDNEGKSSQVQMMDTTHSIANETLMYLGPANDGADQALIQLANLGREAVHFNALKY